MEGIGNSETEVGGGGGGGFKDPGNSRVEWGFMIGLVSRGIPLIHTDLSVDQILSYAHLRRLRILFFFDSIFFDFK